MKRPFSSLAVIALLAPLCLAQEQTAPAPAKITLEPVRPALELDTVQSADQFYTEARTRILVPARVHNDADFAYNMLAALYAKAQAADATLTKKQWVLAIHERAVAGDVEAGYLWGAARMARFGIGLGPNQEVEGYIGALMKKGSLEAKRDYAVLYLSGKGVPKDPIKAFELAKQAADAGLPSALTLLGQMYNSGIGTPRNVEAAYAAWKKAADAGDIIGQYNYGISIASGDDFPQDLAAGLPYLKKAADAGEDRAMYNYGQALSEGMGGLTADPAAGAALIERAALAGNVAAQNLTGHNYAHGEGLGQDDTMASLYWEAAARNGNRAAQFTFAERKRDGTGTPANRDEAISWLKKSAAQDNDNAIADLQEMGIEWPEKQPTPPGPSH